MSTSETGREWEGCEAGHDDLQAEQARLWREKGERACAYAGRMGAAINDVLARANGQTPELVYVGKNFTLGELRHALLAVLHDPPAPPAVELTERERLAANTGPLTVAALIATEGPTT